MVMAGTKQENGKNPAPAVEAGDRAAGLGVTPAEKRLHEFLKQNEFYISPTVSNLIEEVLKTRRKAVLLRGPAGSGKTQLTYLVARYLDAEYVFFQCSFGTSEDDILYKYVPSERTKSGIRVTYGPLPRALLLSRGRRVVLVLDEFDKTRPSADALLLDFLQNCRISLYLNDRETIVHGNPENLVVFLTSNDMREFSEPLLRRVIVISLEPLPSQKVYELLSKKFKKETALLLTQVYTDALNAGLRKPATLQELYQLGELLEEGVQAPLEDLLRMFVVKYDDDWQKFQSYVVERKAYEMMVKKEEKRSNIISQYYEPPSTEIIEKKEEESGKESVQALLEKLKKINVKVIEESARPEKLDVRETIEVTLKLPDNDYNAYTVVIKELKPEATSDPRRFGKFRYVEDEIATIIADSHSPLTLEEVHKLVNATQQIEAYYEEKMLITADEMNRLLIDNATKIKFYTKERIFLECINDKSYGKVIEKLLVERIDDLNIVLRGYVKKEGQLLPTFIEKMYEIHAERNSLKRLFTLLSTEIERAAVDLSAFEDEQWRSEATGLPVARFLENLRKIISGDFKVAVKVDPWRSSELILEKKKEKLTITLGDSTARSLEEKGVATEKEYDLLDETVDRIMRFLESNG